MVKAILFDFWGTLVENGVRSPIKQVRRILNIRLPFSEYVVRMEKAMMTQKFDSLQDAFRAVCNEFSIECTEWRLNRLIGMWNSSWMLAKPYPEVKEVLQKLKEKYQIILISNTDAFSIEQVLAKFSLNELFDHIFFSYKLNRIKSQPEFLQKILAELDLEAKDCLLVGDSLQSDIEPAEEQGVKAVLVDRRETRDFPHKIKDLMELEQYIE